MSIAYNIDVSINDFEAMVLFDTVYLISIFCPLVVTGATDGIGKAYAEEV